MEAVNALAARNVAAHKILVPAEGPGLTAFEYDLCAWICAGVIRQWWARSAAAGVARFRFPLTTS